MENLERVLNDLNSSFTSLFKIIESNSLNGSDLKKYIIMRNIYDFESKFKDIINCMDCKDNPSVQSYSHLLNSSIDEYGFDVYPDDFENESLEDGEVLF